MKLFRPLSVVVLSTVTAAALVAPATARSQTTDAPTRVSRGLVVSQSQRASDVGLAILRRGGNAIDAAVATAFALAVTHPAAGNLGGGGFLVAMLPDGSATTFDFRERAPQRSTPDMFLDDQGEYDRDKHHQSHIAVGVPGSVAGLWLAHQRLGALPWRDLVQPAIQIATAGFEISPGLAKSLERQIERFRKYPASLRQFTADGKPLQPGDRLVQADLARTLSRIRDRGADGFYRGETAALLVAEMERGGGLVSWRDLAEYRAVERRPLRGSYRGFDVISMRPPSSGGVALIEMLNVLETDEYARLERRSAAEVHFLAETMRRAYADRALYLADTDFVSVPVRMLTSKKHATEVRATIVPGKASTSSPETFSWPHESEETTHLCVVDEKRMAVSLTTTLEWSYGSAIVVPGAGFLLNNEMGDFNPRAGWTTEKGAIGTAPNLVAPGKRMLSSMTPTIIAHDGKPVLVVGSPGGRTIINTVLGIVVDALARGMPTQKAVDAPRLHHQWLPDELVVERNALSPDVRRRLEAMGHRIRERDGVQGCAMAIRVLDDGELEGGCDRRRPDGGAAGY